MGYRDDLEAALAHADSAERDLARAREENVADHERIAELEEQLAAAKRGVHKTTAREAKVEIASAASAKAMKSAMTTVGVVGLVLALSFGLVELVTNHRPGSVGSQLPSRQLIDVTAGLAAAKKDASSFMPDPMLKSISALMVNPEGVVDLVTYSGKVDYDFVSPSRTAAPAPPVTGPIGAPQAIVKYPTCAIEIRYKQGRFREYETPGRGVETCGEALTAPPSCTVVEVWNEAIRRGAPTNALASVKLDMRDMKLPGEKIARRIPTWRFSISDQTRTIFEMKVPDGCPFAR